MTLCPYRARAKVVLSNLTFHALPWVLESVSALVKVFHSIYHLYIQVKICVIFILLIQTYVILIYHISSVCSHSLFLLYVRADSLLDI